MGNQRTIKDSIIWIHGESSTENSEPTCLGFAEYFDIDVTVVRIVWLVTAIMTCVGFIPYIIAWIVMPEEPLLLPAHVIVQPATGGQPASM